MKPSLVVIIALGSLSIALASTGSLASGLSDDPEDPQNLLVENETRGGQRESLFPASPLGWFHDFVDRGEKSLYDAVGLDVGFTVAQLYQWVSESEPHVDSWGVGTNADFIARWDLFARDEPHQGKLFVHLQGRWDHGTLAPEELGTAALGSVIQTGNSYAPYESPEVIVRNLYWQMGSPEAGWAFRIGKITPDATLATSAHLSTATTFLTAAGIGSFGIGHADSGIGFVGAWYPSDRVTLVGLVSDANADRSDFGDIDEGDFFKAVQLNVKLWPRTEKAGYSKMTFWHTDGTKNRTAANGNTGQEGWGVFLKHEQELTDDGRAIGILKVGRSFENSAIYKQLAGVSFLLYDPPGPFGLQNDLLGAAFNWAQPTGLGSEYNVELFYRFPLFPLVDMTLSYQSIIKPALDRDNGHASALSVRVRTTF
ncbi:MAG: carbohydrate porin [Deltaproteobacteria bacterium]|nr:carbohydrate porin [Deltaproteobacteria bacterium]